MKQKLYTVKLTKLVNGGQALGQLADGKKVFAWGGLPGETVELRVTKSKRDWAEGIVETVHEASPDRLEPRDPASYLSTSPWQIISQQAETSWKQQLIQDAFQQAGISVSKAELVNGEQWYGYRNKMEFSWYWDTEADQLELGFFKRGGSGKLPVQGSALAMPAINQAALKVRDLLRQRPVEGRELKTLLIRADASGRINAQLYVKRENFSAITDEDAAHFGFHGFEVIYSDQRSPASVISRRLLQVGEPYLSDQLLGVPFRYATEGFFQVNLPVYEQALRAMQAWLPTNEPVVDLYSGVGSIGLTIGGPAPTMIEINHACVEEMRRNASGQGKAATIIEAAAESALDYLNGDHTVILDPPRAGLHEAVTERLLEQLPPRVVYLSCNPSTQARDVARLSQRYGISHHQGFNFFPRTPHIESLVVLDRL